MLKTRSIIMQESITAYKNKILEKEKTDRLIITITVSVLLIIAFLITLKLDRLMHS